MRQVAKSQCAGRRQQWVYLAGVQFLATTLVAGIPLQPGTTLEFASVEEGRNVLGARAQGMSQFERCVRMETTAPVTEAEFVTFVQNQVLAWSAADQVNVSNAVSLIQAGFNELHPALPARVLLIQTTGKEEGDAAYVWEGAVGTIVLSQPFVNSGMYFLPRTIAHELFHVHCDYRPDLRPALYGVIGFRACPEVTLPQSLLDLRITGDPVTVDFYIAVELGEEFVPAAPVIYSKSATYTGGGLFDYVTNGLLILEETPSGLQPRLTPRGEPLLVDQYGVTDYFEQIGRNTSYNLDQEETLAKNIEYLVFQENALPSPRVACLLRQAIQSASSKCPTLLAGRFVADLPCPSAGGTVSLEVSSNLLTWQVVDVINDAPPSLAVRDPEAWVTPSQFYRAREGQPAPLIAGDTNNLVWIPPGSFLMGSPDTEQDRYPSEGPQTSVTLTRGFWMGRFEVTQGEYASVMGTNPSSFPGVWSRPMDQVSWNDAVAYCAQLTLQEQAAGRLPAGYAFRLPTEAEWEYAARAGTTTRFSFGDDPTYAECYRRFWFNDNSYFMTNGYVSGKTRPVGGKTPNPWGLHDMYGNVSEMCLDWFGDYPGGMVTDPLGPASGTDRVIRGGSFSSSPSSCRSAYRWRVTPTTGNWTVGFRVVLASDSP